MIKGLKGHKGVPRKREPSLFITLVISHLEDPSRTPKSNSGKIISD